MNVLSLFDGMSCGQIALNRAGIMYDRYYASEIDKPAISVTQANYPNTIQLGDIEGWRDWGIDWSKIDLILAGSPCQGFSFAGKQLAFDDPRSKLFFTFVEILRHVQSHNPGVKFLLENVKMKKEHLAVITNMLGVEPVFINSALVSAQNRQRYYWTNWSFEQPEDKGFLLKDILEEPGEGAIKSYDEWRAKSDKSQCIDANYHKGVDNHGQRTLIRPAAIVGRKIDENGKRDDNLDQKPVQCLEVQPHQKSRCLSTVAKDSVVSPLEPGRYPENSCYRKLTPIECERLQTVPDNYTAHVSNTQRYKMLGNGWTVDVIVHILRSLNPLTLEDIF